MKRIIYLLSYVALIAAAAVTTACDTEESSSKGGDTNMIKSVKRTYNPAFDMAVGLDSMSDLSDLSASFAYNSDGSIAQVVQYLEGQSYATPMSYEPTQIYAKFSIENIVMHYSYNTDNAGYIESSETVVVKDGVELGRTQREYSYSDDDGYLNAITGDYICSFAWSADNMVRATKRYDNPASTNSIFEYSYHEGTENDKYSIDINCLLDLEVGPMSMRELEFILGRIMCRSVNLVDTITANFSHLADESVYFRFEYDSLERPKTVKAYLSTSKITQEQLYYTVQIAYL